MPARLGEPQRGSALAGEALVGAIRLEIHFFKSAAVTFSVVRLYILMNINVETGWKIWACEPGKSFTPLTLLHTPFTLPGVI